MINVAIQPCGDSDAGIHYQDTILNPVPALKIAKSLSEDQLKEFNKLSLKEVAVWGVTPGVKFVNKNKWAKLKSGDIALLYRNKQIFSQGQIIHCLHSKKLAEDLWSSNAKGDTWEYIYFLDNLQEIEIPIEKFNKALGFKLNNIVQGFNVYQDEKAKIILDLLELDTDYDIAPNLSDDISIANLNEQLNNIYTTDIDQKSSSRAEQPILRKYLFGNKKISNCDLCGKELPVSILVAAHIKKRASCTDSERKDLNIVMSACKLGCDELFEKGYISVSDDGNIQETINLKDSTLPLRNYVSDLSGKKCRIFNLNNKKYFDWHRNHLKRIMK
jgi:hypothetical protein